MYVKKFRGILIAVLVILIGMVPGQSLQQVQAKKEPLTEMNIYAVYLNSSQKGESVILESRGEYLVMDIGVSDCTDAVIKKLKELGADHIGLYFSHLHKDHIGASDTDMLEGLKKIIAADITIDTLYLPDPSLASESVAYPLKYKRLEEFMEGHGEIKYLVLDSEIEIGDAWLNVIGPVYPERMHPQDYADEEYDPDGDTASTSSVGYTYYENNCSLISQVHCGDRIFLATGDALKDEVSQTVNVYGGKDGLDVDILKLSHHGTGSGNVAGCLSAMAPEYMFAQNTYYTGKNSSTGLWTFYGSYRNAIKHGMVYYVGSEKKTLVYHIEDNNISMYEESFSDENRITGWQKLVGGDGKTRDYDYYYVKDDGTLATGLMASGDYYFHFSKAGVMLCGDYDEAGNYLGWRIFDDKRRYYKPLSDGRYYMCRGLTDMADGKTYFFSSSGYFQEATGEKFLKTIGRYNYAFDENAALIRSQMITMSTGEIYYIEDTGRSAVNKIISYQGNKYYFGTYGTMVKDKMVAINGGQYYLTADGTMACNTLYTVDGKTHYFLESGRMAQNEFVTINKKDYYYGKTGLLATNQFIAYEGNSYYVDEEGVKVVSQERTINNKEYYFDSKGIMAKQKLLNLDGATYYYGKYGTRVKNQFFKLSGKTYYAGEDGKIAKDGMQEISGKNYYFNSDGQMQKQAFIKINGNTVYFGKYGTQVKDQMVKADGETYYLNESGYMAVKAQALVKGKVYYFDKDGKMVRNTFVEIVGHKYYFGKSGAMVKGQKVRINGNTYYFDANGALAINRYIILNDTWYYCDENGVMHVEENYNGA